MGHVVNELKVTGCVGINHHGAFYRNVSDPERCRGEACVHLGFYVFE